jgi:hypothetical protein
MYLVHVFKHTVILRVTLVTVGRKTKYNLGKMRSRNLICSMIIVYFKDVCSVTETSFSSLQSQFANSPLYS